MTVHRKDAALDAAGASLAQNTTTIHLEPMDSMNQWMAGDERRDWALSSGEAWRIAERLRGIRAISAVGAINVEENNGNLLSEEVRCGLDLAIHALASDALDVLHFNNQQAMHQLDQEHEVVRQQALHSQQVQPLRRWG